MKFALSCLSLLLLLAQSGSADPLPSPPTLAEALRALPAASVGDGSVLLTVSPERVLPPPISSPAPETTVGGIEMPPDVLTPDILAAQYGRLPFRFGHVLALAPPTMTLLNTSPALADLPLSVLASQHPMPFFLGMLTREQLQQMATTGLAFSDLTPDEQSLLHATLPQPFIVIPKSGGPDAPKQTISEETVVSSLRLHAYLSSDFRFLSPIGRSISATAGDSRSLTPGLYKLENGNGWFIPHEEVTDQLTSYLVAPAPNTPKESDLEWNRPTLARGVKLENLKTVDDLVARLAKATKLELYADPRFGKQPLQIVGDLKTPQPTGEVMQALSLALCGAWRQVGPAFLLTDDVQGLGARQEFPREMVQTWSNRFDKANKEVNDHMTELDWLHTLTFAEGDPGALTSAQLNRILSQPQDNDDYMRYILWKDLPPPLQADLRRQLTHSEEPGDSNARAAVEKAGKAIFSAIKPDFQVGVEFSIRLVVELPGIGTMSLLKPVEFSYPTLITPYAAHTVASAGSIVVDKPLRGVICTPRTPEEARAVVAKLAKMHFNLLYLDVFSGGKTYFPNTALPPSSDKAAGVLQAALEAAKPLHIPIYAVLDTLCWRKDGAALHPSPWPKGYEEDLTVGGEIPAHSVQRQLEAGTLGINFDRETEMATGGSQGWASPFDPAVHALLPALVRTLAATKGLAGIAFQDTAGIGYLNKSYDFDPEGVTLGYTPVSRLAYLRRTHTDPVDLSSGYDTLRLSPAYDNWLMSLGISLPAFQSNNSIQDWNKVRGEANANLMADCYTAAHSVALTLPLLMRERQYGQTFDAWTDPKKLNQYAGTNDSAAFQQITPQSVFCLNYGPLERARPQRLVFDAANGGSAGRDAFRAGSVLFDMTAGEPPSSLLDSLDKLSVLVKLVPKP